MHKIALVLAVIAVGEGLLTLHLVRQLHSERENAQALQARVSELERSRSQQEAGAAFSAVPTQPVVSPFVETNTPVQQATVPVPGNVPSAASASLQLNAAPPDQRKMRERMTAALERQRALLRDPEYREALLSQQKMVLMRSNPDVAKELNLTADETDRLFGTLAQQSLRAMDSMNMWQEQPDPAKLQELQRKAAEQQRANEAELRSVLGDAKYRQWQEYQSMAGVRWEATRLRNSLANAGVPLDESLAKPLMRVLQEQQKQEMQRLEQNAAIQSRAASAGFYRAVSGDDIVQLTSSSVESLAKRQRQLRDALATVLSPEQLEIIQQEHDAELQMQRVREQLLRAQRAAGGDLETMQISPALGYAVHDVMVAPTRD